MRKIHLCISVRGALAQSDKELRILVGNIKHDGVKCRNVHEVRQFLIEALAEGYEYIGQEECDNFDPKKGCMGHPVKDKTEGEGEYHDRD